MIGTTTEGRATYGEHFTIAGSGHCGMTIRSGSSSYGILHFSDGTSGADEYSGMVEYLQGTNRMRIFAGGKYGIVLNGGASVELNYNEVKKFDTQGDGCNIYDADSNVNLYFRTSGGTHRGHIYADTGNHIGFKTTDNEWGMYCQAGSETALYHDGTYVYDTRSYGAKYHTTGGVTLPYGTTAQRPTAENGMIRANSTNNTIEGYINGAWADLNNAPFSASGGSESTSGGYKYHTFNSSGTFTVNTGTATADILIVAGGGGGSGGTGLMHGGGGGAGGMIELTTHTLAAGSYTITVGAGGGNNSNGSNTSAFGNTAIGGGDGGEEHGGSRSGDSGGSGGGASYTGSGGSGTSGQGNSGGAGQSGGHWATGGGGGKGSTGGNAPNNSTAGHGGNGKAWNGTTYAGGGGGCTSGGGTPGNGGPGGGGNGALNASNHGTANRGAGGGGSDRPAVGGNGGSGVVIIKYQT
jgi:hypothetical protein